jgi:hypothetical protein
MRTKKKMAALLLVMIGMTLTCAGRSDADTSLSWDWDSCTLEEWISPMPDIIVTVEDGREETCGIGAALEPDAIHVPTIKIEGQTLDPGALVGGLFGQHLDMTGEIYVDIDRKIPVAHSSYVGLEAFDEDSHAKFACYPYDGYGRIIDLGDGWFRHYMDNVGHWEGDFSLDAGCFYLEYHEVNPLPVGEPPVIFDNLMIAHEPVPVEVGVDIRPALCPNPLSVISKGILPVAILGTNEFDVYDIQPASVSIVIGEVEISAVRHSYKDVATSAEPCVCPSSSGPNGFTDLLLDFRTEDILEALGTVEDGDELELSFTGQLKDLTPIWGSDCVLIRDEML